jgi:hypothetical protein
MTSMLFRCYYPTWGGTVELNNKYKGLNLDDLNNFKLDATVQQWEGEDFRCGVLMPTFRRACF